MIRKKKGEVEWLEFESLADIPGLMHGVFLRHGGVSPAPYYTLNVGGATGDDAQFIAQNRKRIASIFDLQIERLVAGRQCHGTHLEIVTSPGMMIEEGCDGLVTNQKNIGLFIKHADCQAAIFYDPIQHVIANVHCGWRGNVQNIYEKVVHFLRQHFFSTPENLLVCISPSLGPEFSQFINYKTELPESFWEFQIRPLYFNLWEISRMQLEKAGILSHHIEFANICTYQNASDFFSYRRDKITGRHATVVAFN